MLDRSDEHSDEWLVQHALRGDNQAFEALYLRYFKFVCTLIFNVVHDTTCVEDLAQESFVKVHAKLASLRNGEAFKTWLGRIAMNTARDHLRSVKRKPLCTNEGWEESCVVTFEEQIQQELLFYQVVHVVLQRLIGGQRDCFVLHLQGNSPAEISQRLGLTPGTVRTYISKSYIVFREEYLRLRNVCDDESKETDRW
ncbi:RNA polymerase sigma factor [Tengunoibacter tsumagoiensis]|uniref:Sigma-24 n=1 Tax=Tengunoibacter tsumagoiensis TaxID=2014871 RepID=A0A402A5M2_9CHLR|nr:sigma-70 family RNA polymerase sigma factor [Tengunoibacter tsumagoiensis]GCE14428.1 sigma-24 [Tengunoibacter tsumagoiensis]